MTHCQICQRELAQEPKIGKEPICRICGEELLRVSYALAYRGPQSIIGFIFLALRRRDPHMSLTDLLFTSDARLVSALTDYAEVMKGHTVPCDKCNPRRWSKDIL